MFLSRPITRTATSAPSCTPSLSSLPHAPLSDAVVDILLSSYDAHDWHESADALTDWLNARWRKTGFRVSRETVCYTLRANGRKALVGSGCSGGSEKGVVFYREGIPC
ncbi:hypothetical protein B0A54_12382 [Friedmanniomyces endolithicus]|uniref:Uncharacterized protein n=1 Tax=Friedmanniomyces endolithicus TaxID=329885 RepID=A0A4U0UKW5_9PEZI|nr:hypothetical protein B0A54_12382 [Friedmanniomyces endolithicus]